MCAYRSSNECRRQLHQNIARRHGVTRVPVSERSLMSGIPSSCPCDTARSRRWPCFAMGICILSTPVFETGAFNHSATCPALAKNRDPILVQSRQIIASRARCKDLALAQRCTGDWNRSTSASAAMVPNAPHWPPATIRRQSAIPSALRSLYQCQLATP